MGFEVWGVGCRVCSTRLAAGRGVVVRARSIIMRSMVLGSGLTGARYGVGVVESVALHEGYGEGCMIDRE